MSEGKKKLDYLDISSDESEHDKAIKKYNNKYYNDSKINNESNNINTDKKSDNNSVHSVKKKKYENHNYRNRRNRYKNRSRSGSISSSNNNKKDEIFSVSSSDSNGEKYSKTRHNFRNINKMHNINDLYNNRNSKYNYSLNNNDKISEKDTFNKYNENIKDKDNTNIKIEDVNVGKRVNISEYLSKKNCNDNNNQNTDKKNKLMNKLNKIKEIRDLKSPITPWYLYENITNKNISDNTKDDKNNNIYDISKNPYYIIGKSKKLCDIIIDKINISKIHCAIIYKEKQGKIIPFLIDLESTNGTYINKEKIKNNVYYELKHKDNIKLADCTKIVVINKDEK